MQNRWVRDVGAAACALLLLTSGGALLMVGLYALGLATGAWKVPAEAKLVLTIYYKVVVVKGLAPQLLLSLLIWPLLRKLRSAEDAGRLRLWLELLAAAALAFCVVAPLLLSVDFEHWPALSMPGWGSRLANLVMMSIAVAAAAWLPHALLFSRPPSVSPSDHRVSQPNPDGKGQS
jgi:hypothetical protein